MGLRQLANSFHHSKISLDEQKRILYVMEKDFIESSKHAFSTNEKVALYDKQNNIANQKQMIFEREEELKNLSQELLSLLKDANISAEERIEYHIHDNSYFEIWFDEKNALYSNGPYSKM